MDPILKIEIKNALRKIAIFLLFVLACFIAWLAYLEFLYHIGIYR